MVVMVVVAMVLQIMAQLSLELLTLVAEAVVL
jgi:hypothetical protein